jgi:hypothetical protein
MDFRGHEFNNKNNHVLQAGSAQNATGLHLFVRDEIFSFRALYFLSPLHHCSIARHSQASELSSPDPIWILDPMKPRFPPTMRKPD